MPEHRSRRAGTRRTTIRNRSTAFSPSAGVTVAIAVMLSLPLGAKAGASAAEADEAGERRPTLAETIAGLEKRSGLLTVYLDRDLGKVWLELPPAAGGGDIGRFLYVEGLVTGLGSNPVGLDRGQLGPTRVVRLRRLGGRLLIEEENLRYRATSASPSEVAAARQSFATSVLWGGEVAARSDDGRGLVDLTPFIVRDAHGVVPRLREAEQGVFRLEESRSAVDLDACLVFADNLELEALLTFTADEPGALVRDTVPAADSVTLVQHQSLIRLPDDGYRPRAFDPRAGSFEVSFQDHSAPLAEPVTRRWIVRHRLRKSDPRALRSPVIEPIVYHVDRGAPEPVRRALMEGAGWWAEAFEDAGFEDAFRVELLPPDAHPLDLRYNVIQWVHRSTRGWSYGGGVIDPRTGEMVKGHVILGSLRVRHDRLLFEGLVGADASGSGGADDPVELALARIRQLAAHEVGHTLGLAHNFAASTYGRASVMDYPAPLVEIDEQGELDLSRAYGEGVGAWDRHAIRYAYGEFPPGSDEASELGALVDDASRRGLIFLSDADARPPGSAHPRASLWDNGADPVAQLELDMRVRRIALDRFGEGNVRPGQPLALLEEVLATLYFRHRYQVQAVAKLVGGLDYRYALRGESEPAATPVSAARQRRAVSALLALLDPAELDLPDRVLRLLLPRPPGYERHPDLLAAGTAPLFDALGAATAAADLVLAALLQPERAARLVDSHRRQAELPGLDEILAQLVEATFGAEGSGEAPQAAEIRRVVQRAVVGRLVGLASADEASGAVRARAEWRLRRLAELLDSRRGGEDAREAQRLYLLGEIERFLERRLQASEPPPVAPQAPPGEPIGQASALADPGACGWEAG